MRTYLIKRLLLVIPTLWAVATLLFLMVRFVPGDPVDAIIGNNNFSESDKEELREELGLNESLWSQYVEWWGDILRGDFGNSVVTNVDIADEIQRRLPVTLEMGLFAMTFALLIGVPIGVVASVRQDSIADYVARSTAITFLSVPGFWLAIMIIAIGSAEFGWAPNFQYVKFVDDPVANLKQFWLPSFILGLSISAGIMRMTRAMMLEILREDYVRTAWAKGLPAKTVLLRHALRNALIPVITIAGLGLANTLAGTVIFERIFNLPGLGAFLLEAIQRRDYPVVQAVNLVIATIVIIVNLMVDLTYGFLDPSIRQEQG